MYLTKAQSLPQHLPLPLSFAYVTLGAYYRKFRILGLNLRYDMLN